MTPKTLEGNDPVPSKINRRSAIRSTLAATVATGALSAPAHSEAAPEAADARRASPKAYRMKKSINLWAFPYPQRMTLRECLQLAKDAGFDGIELNYDLDNDLSPKASPGQYRAIRKMAEEIGIAISGLCSFLYWPYSLTDNDPARRARGLELARLMIEAAPRAGHREPADHRRLDLHPLAARPRAGADRRLRPPGPRGDRPTAPPGRETRRLPEHREHLCSTAI